MIRNKNITKINKEKPMRIRPQDIVNAVFPLGIRQKKDSSKTFVSEPKPSQYNVNFCFMGKQDILADIKGNEQNNGYPITNKEEETCAIIRYVGENPPKYYVKMNTKGQLFNPIGVDEGSLNKDLKYTGKKMWELKEVNGKIFNFYLNFLKTKNLAWFNNASRENI